jgi:hypothetical protein
MLTKTFTVFLAAAYLAAAATSSNFVGAKQYRAGGYNLQFTMADVNRDGIPDAIASGGEGTVLMLGREDGGFGPPRTIYPASALSVAVADFNRDGKLDLVMSALGNGTSLVELLGNGDGTFQSPISLPLPCTDCSLSAVDFNCDGKMDLAVASTNSFAAYLGNGDGTFNNAKATYPVSFALYIVTGQLNSDRLPDAVVVDSGSLDIFFGNGDGTFHETKYPSASSGFQARLADLNGDGKLDIVTQDRDSDVVIVRLNQGDGVFGPEATFPAGCPFNVCEFQSISVGDINGDGKLDVATPASYLLGNGDGTFGAPVTFYGGNFPNQAVIVSREDFRRADFFGDDFAKIVVASGSADDLTVVRASFRGLVQAPTFVVGARPEDIAAADFNGDGSVDFAVADYGVFGAGGVHIFLNTGNGVMKQGVDLAVQNPGAILAADFNRDGLMDLAVSSQSTGTTIFLGQGNGEFVQGSTYPNLYGDCTNHAVGIVPSVCFATADVNGDGILDLAGANWIDGQITVMLGNGDGTFRLGQTFAGTGPQTGLAIADFNGDGKPDLAFSVQQLGAVVYFGNGKGTFGNPLTLKSKALAAGIAAGDVNGDGIPDIVLAGGQGSSLFSLVNSYFPGEGNGHFGAEVIVPADLAPNAVKLADVNGDGKLDIISANYQANNVSVSVNEGNGVFGTPALYVTGISPCQLTVTDLTGSGLPDVVVVDQYQTITELFHGPH